MYSILYIIIITTTSVHIFLNTIHAYRAAQFEMKPSFPETRICKIMSLILRSENETYGLEGLRSLDL